MLMRDNVLKQYSVGDISSLHNRRTASSSFVLAKHGAKVEAACKRRRSSYLICSKHEGSKVLSFISQQGPSSLSMGHEVVQRLAIDHNHRSLSSHSQG